MSNILGISLIILDANILTKEGIFKRDKLNKKGVKSQNLREKLLETDD